MNNPTNWHEGLEVVLCTYGEEEQWIEFYLFCIYAKVFLQARQNIWGLGISPILFFTDTLNFSNFSCMFLNPNNFFQYEF